MILVWEVLTPQPAMAQQAGDEYRSRIRAYCEPKDTESIDRLLETLKAIDGILPHVPPDEASYLINETRSVETTFKAEVDERKGHSASNRRASILHERPLYYVWATREQLAKTSDVLTLLLNTGKTSKSTAGLPFPPYQNVHAAQLERAADAIDQLSLLLTSLRELLENEQRAERASLFSGEQVKTLSFSAVVMPTDLSSFIRCKVARIAEMKGP